MPDQISETKLMAIEFIKDDLTGGQVVNLELDDTTIGRNIDRAIMFMSMYYTGLTYKTIDISKKSSTGGYIDFSEIDNKGISTLYAVYPVEEILRTDAGLLGLGHIYLSIGLALDNQIQTYANMLQKLSLLDSILGRNARIVGDKLYVDNYYTKITVAYVPKKLEIDDIHDGEWFKWIIEYALALSKRQLAQSRGKYVVQSSPSQPNAETLLSDANEKLRELEEAVKLKGLLIPSR